MRVSEIQYEAHKAHEVESHTEVNQDIVKTLGNLLKEGSGDLLIGRVFGKIDGNQKLLSLGIDITNIDTTLVSEEDPVALFKVVS